ncbi:FAD-dependent thymidylate synthase [Bradyrhizobium septentrionale]|uniref:FAD-dependent thymidylate synthase n=1 Tax=Bradyrhizobium septentrionale TaxID=1404411 RepID=UPI001CD3DF2B|nr:FAD-dependent thymidylate synthase [Bradyrhizobium septentrionale]UGY23815.1 FAD-dependent thymidylate synthase [Bradyrhizobium septentrionale]
MNDNPSNKIDVLDHGYARLVDSMGSDLSVVRAARVSYDAAWRAGEDTGSDHRLIRYLWRNHHTSPFEAVTFTFEVKAPIFVFRQWHRHRTWSYNEVSARYTELPEEFYVPKPEHYGTQSKVNKQVRDIGGVDGYSAEEWQKFLRWEDEQRSYMEQGFALYRKHLAEGMPRELARIILPFATYSHQFASVDLLNLMKFLTLRHHSHSQYEIRVYAEAMLQLIEPIVPECVKAWKESVA